MTGYGKLEKFCSRIEKILSNNIQANPSNNNKLNLNLHWTILVNAHFVTFQYLQKVSIKSMPQNNCFSGNFNFYFILTIKFKIIE